MIMEKIGRPTTTDYTKVHAANGTTHGVGSSRFAGQTRDVQISDNSLRRTTYGTAIIDGLVCTISETLRSDLIDSRIKAWEYNEDVPWFRGEIS